MHNKVANCLKNIPLFDEEIGVINSCLLGDGTIGSSGKFHRLRIEHSSAQSEYVWWKYSLLKRIVISQPKEVPSHNSVRFGTIGHPKISEIKKLWYKDSKKNIPKKINLSDLSIAIWFMDDGCKHRDTVDFSVHNYSIEDIKYLQECLKEKKIDTTINSDGKGSRLYVKKNSYPVFKELVKPFILECMAYKLP